MRDLQSNMRQREVEISIGCLPLEPGEPCKREGRIIGTRCFKDTRIPPTESTKQTSRVLIETEAAVMKPA